MLVNILLWALFGLLAGAVAKYLMPGNDPGGIVVTILLGIAGAVVGGYLSSLLFKEDINSFSLVGFAVAVGGAVLLLILYRVVTSGMKRAT
jgi:uncharacterized membrane protein YeaQ/YmgE (transglycosylase-associated protein family)